MVSISSKVSFVPIEQHIRLLWATVVGMCVLYTIGELRSAWQPHATVGIRAETGGEPCGDGVSQAVSLVVLWGVEVFMFMC